MKIGRKLVDYLNNRIINVKTNTPTHKDHIVPKEYVDNSVHYKTVKSNKYKNPFKFPWMKNSTDKPVTTILDELLYPEINPEYVEAVVNGSFRFDNKNINLLSNTKMYVDWEFENNDRLVQSAPKVEITLKNGTVTTHVGANKNKTGVIEFTVVPNTISKLEIVYEFGKNNVTKKTTYGTDYVSDPFKVNKTISKELSIENNGYRYSYSLLCLSDTLSVIKPIYDGFKVKTELTLTEITAKGLQPTIDIINHKAVKGTYYHENTVMIFVDEYLYKNGTLRFFDQNTYFDLPFSLGEITPIKIEGKQYFMVMFDYKTTSNSTPIKLIN